MTKCVSEAAASKSPAASTDLGLSYLPNWRPIGPLAAEIWTYEISGLEAVS